MKLQMQRIMLYLFLGITFGFNQTSEINLEGKFLPVSKQSGFKMDGYYVWCGSMIKVDSRYHLFASRWPKLNKFPVDYFTMSEIVRAESDSPLGPFEFKEVIIGERNSSYWDSNMAHNPTIQKIGNEYVLFYIGRDFTTMRSNTNKLVRRIGYATAKSIYGPWHRSNKPVIDAESNNPAVLVDGGKVRLIYRNEQLRTYIAEADNFRGPYKTVNDNVWPECKIEDFYLYKSFNKVHMICEDNVGGITGHVRWGAHLFSENGLDNWKKYDPVIEYDHDIVYDDGDTLHCVRRERPQLLIQDRKITHLITAVFDGTNSWCQPVQLSKPIELK